MVVTSTTHDNRNLYYPFIDLPSGIEGDIVTW